MALATLTVDLILKAGGFESDMGRASKTAQKRLKEIERAAVAAGKVIGSALVAAGAAAALAVRQAINTADEMGKMAEKIGIPVEALSRLSYAAKQADVDLATFQGGVTRLIRAQADAASGTEAMVELFAKIGVEFKNADGTLRSTEEVLKELADVFARMPNGAEKTALAVNLLGRSGAELIPLLNEGSAGLEEMGRRAEELGIVITDDLARGADEFNDNLDDLKSGVSGLALATANELLPELIAVVDRFSDFIRQSGGVKGAADDIASAFRYVSEVAGAVVDTVQAAVNAIMGLVNAVGALSKFNVNQRIADLITGADTQAEFDRFVNNARVGFSGALDELGGMSNGGSAPPGFGRGIRGGGPFAGTQSGGPLFEPPEESAGGGGRGRRGPDLQAQAMREAEEAARDLESALNSLNGILDQQASVMGGPLADAALRYRDELLRIQEAESELQRLGQLTSENQAALNQAREQAARLYAEETAAIQEQLTPMQQLLSDAQFELELMKMSNAERQTAIQLRGMDAASVQQYGEELLKLNQKIEETARVTQGLDIVRGATADLFSDIASGAKSASEAFKDFVDSIVDNITRMVSQMLAQQLFGDFGSSGTGSAGGLFSSFFSTLFGGGRAAGGPVDPSRFYMVGERGPELFVPNVAGTIVPSHKTRAMSGTNITVNYNRETDSRTPQQIAQQVGEIQRRATARNM